MAILDNPWPPELDPSRVPFRKRTITVLRGMGLWEDMSRIDELTVDDVAGYWVTGPVTVNDLITTANEAIEWHHNPPARLRQVVGEDWARQVWRRDLRFKDLLPAVDSTVRDIAVSGQHNDQHRLLETLSELEERIDTYSTEIRDEALIRYVSSNTGQSRERTLRLLQSLGFLEPRISGGEAGRRLGVSPQRVYQLVAQIRIASNKPNHPATPPRGYPKTSSRYRHSSRGTG